MRVCARRSEPLSHAVFMINEQAGVSSSDRTSETSARDHVISLRAKDVNNSVRRRPGALPAAPSSVQICCLRRQRYSRVDLFTSWMLFYSPPPRGFWVKLLMRLQEDPRLSLH